MKFIRLTSKEINLDHVELVSAEASNGDRTIHFISGNTIVVSRAEAAEVMNAIMATRKSQQ